MIYRDKRLVNWDPHFQTAISDLEVENIEKDGHFWHFKYPLEGGETYTYVEKDEDGNITLSEERDYISIATTRPEINDYEVAKRNDIPMYSLMDERGAMCESEIMPAKYVGMDRFKARKAVVADIDAEGLLIAVEDKKVMQPFGDRSGVVIEPMLTDQWFVAADKLAGEAMEAVARGHDNSLSQRERGDREAVGEGTQDAESRKTDTSDPSSDPSGHLLPMGEGDKGATRFIPENWKKTYDHWMKDIQPWCISRQLWWGHQIPAWYTQRINSLDSDAIIMRDYKHNPDHMRVVQTIFVGDSDQNIIDQVRAHFDKLPNVVFHSKREQDLVFKFDGKNGPKLFSVSRDPDVLDTWFSSGLWPFSTLGWPENTDELERFYPTSVVVTAFDIIFFWIARMMMQGLHFMDDVPFKDIYIHALVLDEAGKKMSKSIGNTLDPLDLIDGVTIDELVAKRTRGLKNPEKAPKIEKATRKQYPDGFEPYGADALRFTLASMAGQGRNIRLSVDRIAGYRNFGTKLWSAATFGQMNGCKPVAFDPSTAKLALNTWIISETVKTTAEVSRCIEGYRFSDAADAAYKFAWDTFCAWYLEMSKPVLSGADGAEKDETRAAFAWTLDQILKLLHPFMPFITEELWLNIADSRDSHLIVSAWPDLADSLIDDAASKDIAWVQTLITNLRSVRADMNIPPSKKAPLLMLADTLDPRLAAYAEVLSPMARVDGVETASEAPKGALQTVVDGVTYAIPLDGLIDKGAEKARLTKEAEKAQTEIDKIDKKLSNKAFTDKAPEKVVNLQKERREGYVAELEKLNEALANLG